MTPTAKKSNHGFVRIIVIVIVLLIVFTATGFSFQDALSIDTVITQAQNTWQKASLFYHDVLQTPIQKYAITPAKKFHTLIDFYIINQLTDFLKTLIKASSVT